MKYCHQCGKEIPETAKVCGYCGTKQIADRPPPPPEPVEVEPVKEEKIESPPPPPPEPEKAAPEPTPLVKPVKEEKIKSPPPPEPEPKPVAKPKPARKPQAAKRPVKEKKQPEGKRNLWWLWVILALAILAALYFFVFAPMITPSSTGGAGTGTGAGMDPPNQPEAEEPSTSDSEPPPQPEEERLSSAFISLEWIEDIEFSNPEIGENFEDLETGGITVYGQDWETWGYYDLAHALTDGYTVFFKYRHSEDAIFSFNWQNHEPWGQPGYRAVALYRSPDEKIVQKIFDDNVVSLDYLDNDSPDEWLEAFFAQNGEEGFLVREETPDGFYSYYDYVRHDLVGGDWFFTLTVFNGWVEVEQVSIFTFDDIDVGVVGSPPAFSDDLDWLLPGEEAVNAWEIYDNIRNLTDPYDLNELMQGGENMVERTLYIQRTDSVVIPVRWCEVSAEKVAEDFETFEIDFLINGQVVGEEKIGIVDYGFEGFDCRAWTIAVEEWPPGIHEIVAYWEFTEEIFETTLEITIPRTEIYQIFNVIVD